MRELPHFITADAIGSSIPIEMFSLEKQKNRLITANDNLQEAVKEILLDLPSWLPVAAEEYNISKNIKDYILTPVISMPSDLPNRNIQSFPLSELTRWLPDHGCIAYKTFTGKPTFTDHNNKNHTVAKGIILSTILKPIRGSDGDLYKLIKLAAWDRNRDPVLANDILTRKRNSYSMGAYCQDFSCSICDRLVSKGRCEHLNNTMPQYILYDNVLAYMNCIYPVGFELSSVTSPAYYSAKDVDYFTM